MDLVNGLGFLGTFIVALAYLPQIYHLLKEHCAWGIDFRAWCLWLVAALLILPSALRSGNKVFMILQLVNVIAIAFIAFFTYYHRGPICPGHHHWYQRFLKL